MSVYFQPAIDDKFIIYDGTKTVQGVVYYYSEIGGIKTWYDPSGEVIEEPIDPREKPLKFTAKNKNAAVTLNQVGTAPWSGYYSLDDGSTWSSYTLGTTITLAAVDDSVCFKGEYSAAPDTSNYLQFNVATTGGGSTTVISDNIMSLCSGDDFASADTIPYSYCFFNMFRNCSSLKNPILLPATTLAPYCYYQMFAGCGNLTTAPELPATTLAPYCYAQMFASCQFTTAPELPATTLVEGCYYDMFHSCSSLVNTPELPVMTLAKSCYEQMFWCCTALTEAPELPATTLASSCYFNMFKQCNSLVNPPELPATTLASSCYSNMFWCCTSLESAPELPATTLQSDCYRQMFYSCTSLEEPPVLSATTLASGCYYRMFYNCSSLKVNDTSTGLSFFNCPGSASSSHFSGMFYGTGGSYTSDPVAGSSYYYIPHFVGLKLTANNAGSTITLNQVGTAPWSGYYSIDDGDTWTEYVPGTTGTITLAAVDDSVCFKGTMSGAQDTSNHLQFAMSGSVSASGNVMSMCCGDNYINATTIPYDYCFYYLFYACRVLTSAPALPATNLANTCYKGMFYGCTSLTTPPTLPTTTVVYYSLQEMFYNCSSLRINNTGAAGTLFWTAPSTSFSDYATNMFTGTGGSYTSDPVADGTYYYY